MTTTINKRIFRFGLLLIALGIAVIVGSHYTNKVDLPVFGKVQSLNFVDQNARPFSTDNLRGRIWIGALFFTTCNGPCPMMSQKMSTLQSTLEDTNVGFLSFTVDPDTDTPEVLKAYSERFGAEEGRWYFLTAEINHVLELAKNSLKLSAGEIADMHSTRLVLIDEKSQVRGYYDSYDDNAMAALVKDAKALGSM